MTFSVKPGSLHRRAQLTRRIHDLEAEIILQTQEAGKLAYAAHCGGLSGSAQLQQLLEKLDALHGELSSCRRELDACRGLLLCSACGASNAPTNVYCGSCGAALSRPEGRAGR